MKKIGLIIMVMSLALSLLACSRKQDPTVTQPSTQPAPTVPTVPQIDPTMGTNIPDPTVNDNSTNDDSLIGDTTDDITGNYTTNESDVPMNDSGNTSNDSTTENSRMRYRNKMR